MCPVLHFVISVFTVHSFRKVSLILCITILNFIYILWPLRCLQHHRYPAHENATKSLSHVSNVYCITHDKERPQVATIF